MEASVIHAPTRLARASTVGPLLRLRSDDQLVALFRMGYDDAFGVIHDRYRRRLFAYTRQMLGGSRSDAEDALQDVFLRAYGALRQDQRPVTLRAWLYRVAHNRCIDELRRPTPPPADIFARSRGPLLDPLTEAERREELRRLVQDVQRLPKQQRSALLMRELEGLSYAELADALGVSVPAIKSLLVRARLSLIEATEARDVACVEIRADLAGTFDRGVRVSARSRRHLRDCAGCRDYKRALRGARKGFDALSPGSGPLAALAKLLGIGGSGAGAAATASAGGSAAVVGGGATATVTAGKVVAVVCCAAVVGGGAVEVREQMTHAAPEQPAVARKAAPRAAGASPTAATAATNATQSPAQARRRVQRDEPEPVATVDASAAPGALSDPVSQPTAAPEEIQSGGTMAPDEPTEQAIASETPTTEPPSTEPSASDPAVVDAAQAATLPSPAPGTEAGESQGVPDR